MRHGKYLILATAILFVAVSPTTSMADEYYMGHCSDNEQYSPEEIISSCTTFIDRAMKENWKQEYIPNAFYYMGVARRRQGDVKAAEKYFGLAIARVPGYFAPWRQLVELMTGLSGKDSSLKAIDLIMARYPHDSHVLNLACWELATMNVRLDTALADCNESLRIVPGEAGTLKSRGFVEYRLANYPASISDSTAALAVKPNDAAALYVRGLAKLKSGQTAEGDTDIAAASAIDADIAATFAKYGATP
jgi:tetratricopeptide (TPR) repeat protein